jgi:RNA polymerase sigma factor (sigma-70 family)
LDVTVNHNESLVEQFEAHRSHLNAVAYRMLGSLGEAEDAVQEAWLRLSRSDTGSIENLRAWLTVVVARVCLDMLRSRKARREESLDLETPKPIMAAPTMFDPEQQALLADSVGLALLVVLDTLAPDERLAFVLHDMFAVPFDEIALIVGRSSTAARQLASHARRRIQGADMLPHTDLARQQEVVNAFLAASRDGNFEVLLTVLDPDVMVRADSAVVPPGGPREVHGARDVAKQALTFSRRARFGQLALVNGAVGIIVAPRGRLFAVLIFSVKQRRITEIDIVADPARLHQLDLAVLRD